MFRNLFSLFAWLTVGVTSASASVQPATDRSLDERLANAQKKIETIMTGREMAPPPGADKVDVAWGNIYIGGPQIYIQPPWNNWSNWDNWQKWHKWHKWHNDYNGWGKWGNQY
jgi:hypothetical protein